MATLMRKQVALALGLCLLGVGAAGCTGGGAESSGSKEATPSTERVSGSVEVAAADGSGSADAPGRDAFIYAAVIEHIVEETESGQGDRPFKVLFVLDGAVATAAEPPRRDDPQRSFSHDVKDGVHFLGAPGELPPIEFVATRDAAVVGTRSGKRPGKARDGGALITLGPIDQDGNRIEVASSLWVNGLWGQWQTYVLTHRGGIWRVTGTTGPLAIS
jgi:hypothetical protein